MNNQFADASTLIRKFYVAPALAGVEDTTNPDAYWSGEYAYNGLQGDGEFVMPAVTASGVGNVLLGMGLMYLAVKTGLIKVG